ncbi:MAG: TIGR03086 family metal-binding protein [Actinomycetota bacterium]
MDIAQLHRTALKDLTARVEQIRDDQWELPTPNTGWNVKDLVQHLVSGTLWVKPLVEGETIAEIGNRFDGDVLGEDPISAWKAVAGQAVQACLEPGAMERKVDLSSGPTLAADYTLERVADAAMHTWDLSRALGLDDTIDPEVVAAGRALLAKVGDLWRQYGALGPIVPTSPEADEQTRFIAESGRTP